MCAFCFKEQYNLGITRVVQYCFYIKWLVCLFVYFFPADAPLRCYVSGSFYLFLKSFFLQFGFPDLNTFQSLIPMDRKPEVHQHSSIARPLSIAALLIWAFSPAAAELHLYSRAERVPERASDARRRVGTLPSAQSVQPDHTLSGDGRFRGQSSDSSAAVSVKAGKHYLA